MSDTSKKISYESLAIDGLKEVLVHINEICKSLNIDFFIVGAIARNIWYVANNVNTAGTKDIDFGVYIPQIEDYENLKIKLQNEYGYTASKENAFCLISPEGKQIDLLPFGEIESEGQVMVEGEGLTRINLDGFKEVFNAGLKEVTLDDTEYSICSIPSVVILKLIAFDDRPDQRVKDVKDIVRICKHYPDIETNNIWDNHNDLYVEDRSHEDVAMIVLGREMKLITKQNEKLHNRILDIIDRAIEEESSLMVHMIEDSENETLEQKRSILLNIKKGMLR